MNKAQHVHDTLKVMRATGEAWLTHGGERMRIVPLAWRKHGCFDVPCLSSATGEPVPGGDLDGTHFDAVVKSRRAGGVAIASVDAYKDVGSRIRVWESGTTQSGRAHMAGWEDVLAIVAERHPRTG